MDDDSLKKTVGQKQGERSQSALCESAGFEPAAFWFSIKYSNQLSYEVTQPSPITFIFGNFG